MENKEESIKELPNKINNNQIMKKNEELKQVLEYSIMVSDLLENEARVGIFHKLGKYMRIFSYLVLLTLDSNGLYLLYGWLYGIRTII